MRYRYSRHRYAVLVGSPQAWFAGEVWTVEGGRRLLPARWRPDADVYETVAAVEILVDLAGLAEDDVEVQLFEDALVIRGQRRLPACQEGAVYHA
ncbi:MAG TPA: Hsp20 family protein, partial [Calidithermus sp.]|nr:Hsp20 family protein [Calidithermus sp.]